MGIFNSNKRNKDLVKENRNEEIEIDDNIFRFDNQENIEIQVKEKETDLSKDPQPWIPEKLITPDEIDVKWSDLDSDLIQSQSFLHNERPLEVMEPNCNKSATANETEEVASMVKNQKEAEASDEQIAKETQLEIDRISDEISNGFHEVNSNLTKLSRDFEDKLKYDEHKNKIIDIMHKELQGFKDESQKERILPIMMDLILSIDLTNKMMRSLDHSGDSEPGKIKKVVSDSILDLEDILLKQGIESFECEGNSFDSNRQKVVKKVKTDHPELEKKIYERLGKGYEMDGKIIRKEQIAVYVFEQTK